MRLDSEAISNQVKEKNLSEVNPKEPSPDTNIFSWISYVAITPFIEPLAKYKDFTCR